MTKHEEMHQLKLKQFDLMDKITKITQLRETKKASIAVSRCMRLVNIALKIRTLQVQINIIKLSPELTKEMAKACRKVIDNHVMIGIKPSNNRYKGFVTV